jgi:drug/metabolite transporter (DMT)-like permease
MIVWQLNLWHSWADGATALTCMGGILLVVQPPFLFQDRNNGVSGSAALLTLFGSLCAAMGMITIRMIGPNIDPLLPGMDP